ncbi:MAG: COX15/CtaA family protein [Pseudomonadales bacterium]|nr:COX15/CtaA family protein [Pseudomonadales bacterium]
MKSSKLAYSLVLFATVLALGVVILGAFTRLKDAGLGCPDWPGCYGHLVWPGTPEQIAAAEARFPDAPFEVAKAWPEVVHRYFAGTLGFVIILIAALAWRNRAAGTPLKLPLFLLLLVIAQGLFGMWTVTLKLWPQVVTAHLLGGFTTLSLLWLLSLRLSAPAQFQAPPALAAQYWQALRPLALGGLAVVVAQILLGGWTSTNYAALACPDLPTCQGRWWPPMDAASGFNILQEIGPNYLGGQLDGTARVAIHMGHRIGALVVTGYLIFLLSRLYRAAGTSDPALRRQANVIAALLAIQLCLGLSNVHWSLPLPVAVAHNAGGALLLLSLVSLNYRLYKSRSAAK